jgi:hypothetical protein
MNPKQIQAIYSLQCGVNTGTFTLSDSSRYETDGAADQDLAVTLLGGYHGGEAVYFEFENIIKIKRAKIDAVGAPGLQRPYISGSAGVAAVVAFNLAALNGVGENVGGFKLLFPNWGEWFDVNVKVRPFETSPAPSWNLPENRKPIKLQLASAPTVFAYDGYNLSADYVGQDYRPVITLDVETAGVYNNSFVLI